MAVSASEHPVSGRRADAIEVLPAIAVVMNIMQGYCERANILHIATQNIFKNLDALALLVVVSVGNNDIGITIESSGACLCECQRLTLSEREVVVLYVSPSKQLDQGASKGRLPASDGGDGDQHDLFVVDLDIIPSSEATSGKE